MMKMIKLTTPNIREFLFNNKIKEIGYMNDRGETGMLYPMYNAKVVVLEPMPIRDCDVILITENELTINRFV